MAFTFGNIRQNTSKKDVGLTRKNHVIHTVFKDTSAPTYLILTDRLFNDASTDPKVAARETAAKKYFLNDLSHSSMKNYVVASAINVEIPIEISEDPDESIDTSFMFSNESQWRSLLKKHDITAVLAMGPGFYCAQKSTDTWISHYLDDMWHEPRAFLSEEFCKCGDVFYYPSYSLDEVYPLGESATYSNYKTMFFKAQIERMCSDDQDPEKSIDMRPYEIRVVRRDEVRDVLKSLMGSDLLAIDTETSGFDRMVDRMGCVSLTNDGVTGYFIWTSDLEVDGNMRLLSNVLTSSKRVTLVNAKFDVPFLWRYGVSRKWLPTDDSMLLAHTINSSRFKGLKSNAIFDTRFGGYDDELDKMIQSMKLDSYLDVPEDVLSRYAGLDAIVTWRLHVKLSENVKRLDKLFPNEKDPDHTMEWWYEEIMMPKYRYMIEMEFEGAHVDEDELMTQRDNLRTAILKQEDLIWNILKKKPSDFGFDFKFGGLTSTEDLGYFLALLGYPIIKWSSPKPIKPSKDDKELRYWQEYEKHLPNNLKILFSKGGKTFRKVPSTSDDALTDWEVRGLECIKEIKDFRSLQMGMNMFLGYRMTSDDHKRMKSEGLAFGQVEEEKKKKTGTSGWEEYFRRHVDGTLRFHTNFNAFGAETFRHKSRDPNTQQIPSRGMLAKFVCPTLTCPVQFEYTIGTDGEPIVGFGNRVVFVMKDGRVYKKSLTQLKVHDSIVGITDELAPDHLVIQVGTNGPIVRDHLGDLTGKFPSDGETRVVKSISKRKLPEEYFLVSLDLASAQVREAAIDQIMNDTGIDPVMFDLYGSPSDDHPTYGSLFADMHSVTAYGTFVSTQAVDVIEIHDDVTGRDWKCYPGSELWVLRAGEKVRTYVEDLKSDDEILDYEYTRDK